MDVAQEPRAGLGPSAHVDTFCRDSLPPADQWPELLFELPELHYPDRLNCAAALLDDVVARLRPGPPLPAHAERDAGRYGAAARSGPTRSRTCWPRTSACVPGNRVLLRGPNNPWLVACWLAVLKAGGGRGDHDAAAARRRADRAGARSPGPTSRCATHRFADDLRRRPAAGSPVRHLRRRRRRRPDRPLRRGRRRSPPSTPPPTTSRCSPSPPAPPACPKATMHFHRDVLAIADTFSGTCSGRARTTCSPARRRWRSPSASAACWSSRCGPARRPC